MCSGYLIPFWYKTPTILCGTWGILLATLDRNEHFRVAEGVIASERLKGRYLRMPARS